MTEVEVVAVDLEVWTASPKALARLEILLDSTERAAANRLVRPELRSRYVASHAGLRIVLASRIGIPPEVIRILRSPCHRCGGLHGRPYLGNSSIQFSLAHCDDRALVAIREDYPVGVDIEQRRPLKDARLIASYIATPDELASIEATSHNFDERVLDIWVKKEAMVKATGEGLAAVKNYSLASAVESNWTISTVAVGPSHVAAFATQQPRTLRSELVEASWLTPPWFADRA